MMAPTLTKNYQHTVKLLHHLSRLRCLGAALAAACLALGPLKATTSRPNDFNVRDFGAVGDGKMLNTQVIQRAIDECAAAGGGEVRVPAGVFLTGTLHLKSHITLHLMPGSVLQGSSDPRDYPDHDISAHRKFSTITHDGAFIKNVKSLIISDKAHDVSIVGEGAIRGAGEVKAFQLGVNKEGKPGNLFFIGCENVRLRDIRVLNAAQLTIAFS